MGNGHQAMGPEAFNLTGKKALVSGAGRGIGEACSLALGACGAEVLLMARTGNEIEDVAARIRAAGGQATAIAVDATDIPAFTSALEAHGPVDIFVNNAGTNRPADFLEVTQEDFDAVFALNVKAAFFCAQAVARGMKAAGRQGSIINMSSQMALVGGKTRSVYCASKSAMEGMTRAMALDLAPHGIRVNTVCPTFIETPLTRPFLADKAFMETVLASIPLGRTGHVEEIANAVVFLAAGASSLMTGSALVVDGGWTAR